MTDEPKVTVFPPTVRQAGDPRKSATWTLMPVDTRDGQCSQCGVKHEPEAPHNPHSLYYQYAFYAEHDRWPTWLDAMAHCDEATQEAWKRELRKHGVDL